MAKLGRSLGSSVEQYNKLVGSFDSRVLPGARRFTEMGIQPGRELEATQPLDKAVRQSSAALDDGADDAD
jgi:DNA recombination protein RmuC